MAATHDRRQVLHEHHGVERIAAESPADEERAALPEKPPHDRNVEIDTCCNVRDGVAVHVDGIRQQQVVHVAAVARHVDDLVALGDLPERLDVPEVNTVIQPVPQPRQCLLHEAHERGRVVGGDLLGVTPGLQNGLAA